MSINPKWLICGLLLLATIISYIDRQAFSIVAPVVAKEFNFSNEEIAFMAGAFLLAYAFGQMLSGRIIDYLGNRKGFSVAITLWSIAQGATAFAGGVPGFTACRFLLGIGESGNFPGGVKVIAKWFSKEERALAVGIFTSGASMGAILAPPLITFIIVHFGWRPAFVLTSLLGFFWLIAWLIIYQPDKLARREEKYVRDNLRGAQAQETAVSFIDDRQVIDSYRSPWIQLFRQKQILGVTLARFFEEPLAWCYLTWLPKYLVDYRDFEIMQMGLIVTIPYITLDLGYIAGGWISSRLIRKGYPVSVARKSVMVISCLLMTSSIAAPFANDVTFFIVLVSIATMAHGLWTANVLTLPADLVPQQLVGSVYGITATGGSLGGLIIMQITGIVADRTQSFDSMFVAVGLLPLIAALVVLLGIGKVTMLEIK